MTEARQEERRTDADRDATCPIDIEARRERLAALIGRLIARHWLHARADRETQARERREAGR